MGILGNVRGHWTAGSRGVAGIIQRGLDRGPRLAAERVHDLAGYWLDQVPSADRPAAPVTPVTGEGVECPVPVHPLRRDVCRVQQDPEVHFLPGAAAGLLEPHLGSMSGGLVPEVAAGWRSPEAQFPQRRRGMLTQDLLVRVLCRRI